MHAELTCLDATYHGAEPGERRPGFGMAVTWLELGTVDLGAELGTTEEPRAAVSVIGEAAK